MASNWHLQPYVTPITYSAPDVVKAIATDNSYLYVALASGVVAKVSIASMTAAASVATTGVPNAIAVKAGKVYVGNTSRTLTRITASSMAIDTTLTLATGSTIVTGIALIGTTLYASTTDAFGSSSAGKVSKVDASAMTLTATQALASGQNDPRGIVAGADGYLYVCCYTAPARVAKIDPANFSATPGNLTLASGEDYATGITGDSDHYTNQYLYLALSGGNSALAVVDGTALNRISSLTLPNDYAGSYAITYLDGSKSRYVYLLTNPAAVCVVEVDIAGPAVRLSRTYKLPSAYTNTSLNALTIVTGGTVFAGASGSTYAIQRLTPNNLGLVLTAILNGDQVFSRENRVDLFDAIGRANRIAVQYQRAGRTGELTHLVWPQTNLDAQLALVRDHEATLTQAATYFILTDVDGTQRNVVLGPVEQIRRAPANMRLRFKFEEVDVV